MGFSFCIFLSQETYPLVFSTIWEEDCPKQGGVEVGGRLKLFWHFLST
jgi:hypothetical protein